MEVAIVIVFVGALVFLAHLFAALFSRTRIPDVLPLVFLGLLVGPILGIIPEEAFGQLGSIFTTIALVMILFESGIGLNFQSVHESLLPGLRITLSSYVIAVAFVWVIAIPIFNMTVLEALILGSILGATGPAVVIPLVKQIRLQDSTRTILLLETTLSEALCILVTLGFLQLVKYESLEPGLMVGQLISSFILAVVIGALFAFFWSSVLKRVRRLENSMFLTPAFVFIIYGITEILGYSGPIAALAFGIILGNIHSFHLPFLQDITSLRPVKLKEIEKAFFSEAVFLLKTFFFVYIGLTIKLNNLSLIVAGLLLTIVLYVVRIPVVRMAMNSAMSRFDASISSIMIPKGMAAAVLASLPILASLNQGHVIQEVVYAIILFSIMATAVLSFLIEKKLFNQPYDFVFSGYTTETGKSLEEA